VAVPDARQFPDMYSIESLMPNGTVYFRALGSLVRALSLNATGCCTPSALAKSAVLVTLTAGAAVLGWLTIATGNGLFRTVTLRPLGGPPWASAPVAKHAVVNAGIKQRLTDSTYLFISPSVNAGNSAADAGPPVWCGDT